MAFSQTRLLVLTIVGLLTAAPWASAAGYTITVNSTAQEMQPFGQGCTITEALLLVDLSVQAIGPGIRPGEPLIGNCTMEIGGDGITIIVPAGEYVLTTPYLNMDGQAGFPLIGPTNYPFIGVPWGVRIVGDPAGGTIIKRDTSPTTPAFRFFRVQTWLELEHLTLSGGDAGGDGGGAIFGDDSMLAPCPIGFSGPCRIPITLRHVTFENNRAYQGGAVSSTFRVYGQGVSYTIEDSTFRGNHATGEGGAIRVPAGGAATIRGGTFENNSAGQSGGAIVVQALDPIEIEGTSFVGNQALNQNGGAIDAPSVRLTRVVMRENTALSRGGALYGYGGRHIVLDSTFTGNDAREGGGIYSTAGGIVEIRGSTFANNVANQQSGGAIDLHNESGWSLLTNSTFSGNEAVDRGGAVYVYGGGLTINNVTVTLNKSGYGPGLALGWWGGSHVIISNSIAAGNLTTGGTAIDVQVGGDDLQSHGYNIIGTDLGTGGRFTGVGDQVGTETSPLDAGLLPLADNGGPTPTHALAPGSLALDAGSPISCEATDQRGQVRPGPPSTACDVGAFEHGTYYTLTVNITGPGSITGIPGLGSCRGNCTVEIGAESTVVLTAQPDEGFAFVRWTAGCGATWPVCHVDMRSSQTIAATFAAAGGESSTYVVSFLNPSTEGQEVEFQAQVIAKAPAIGSPTGTVTFIDTSTATVLGTKTLVNGLATITTSALPAGFRTIQVLYSGDAYFSTSVGTMNQAVVGAGTTTTTELTSSINPAALSDSIVFRVTVRSADASVGTPSGAVSFVYGPANMLLGSMNLNAAGQTELPVTGLPIGTHRIRAIYAGQGPFPASSDELAQTISGAAPKAIRNGVPEARPQFNGVGTLRSPAGGETCTATLVSRLVVLTAAQCVRHIAPGELEFAIDAEHIVPVTDIRIHPQFEDSDGVNLPFDLALLKLDDAAATWTGVAPAAVGGDDVPIGIEGTAIGFDEARTSGALLVNDYIAGGTEFGLVVPNAFIEALPANSQDHMFCRPGVGGPLMVENRIAGVASFRTVATCEEAGPGYYLTLKHLLEWIEQTRTDLDPASDSRATTTTIAPLSAPVQNPLTLTAVVTASSGSLSPTGSVEFTDIETGQPLGDAALTNGIATLENARLDPGTYEISATYSGDSNFDTSTASISFSVVRPPDIELRLSEEIAISEDYGPVRGPAPMTLTLSEDITVSESVSPLKGPAPMTLTLTEQVTVSESVDTIRGNTTPGLNIEVRLNGVSVLFAEVTVPGDTTATPALVPPPPSDFEHTSPPTTFDIGSTAVFTGNATVCLSYPPASIGPRLMHFEGSQWVDRTTTVNSSQSVVCGVVPHLSPFAVFMPRPLEGRMHGQGEVDAAGDHHFEFRVAERRIGDERGRVELTIKTPKIGKQKARTDKFVSTDVGSIWFSDDPGFRPGPRPRPTADSVVFEGIGKWNGGAGYSFEAHATDQGEPGRGRDSFRILVRDGTGAVVAQVDGVLTEGNVQSQRLNRR